MSFASDITFKKHQTSVVKRARCSNLLLAHDPGLGKTLSILKIFDNERKSFVLTPGPNKNRRFRMLVVCPILVISNAWIPQIEEHTFFIYSVIYNTKPKLRLEALRKDADIYLINPDQFKILSEEIREVDFNMLVIDESSCLKSNTTDMTKCTLSFAGFRSKNYKKASYVTHRYCLSGTPAPNGRHEYWGQVNFVQPELLNTNFYAFRDKFFYSINIGPGLRKWEFKKSMVREFETTIAPAVDVALNEEVQDWPESTDIYYTTPLSNKEKAAYTSMKEELVLEIGDVEVLSQYQITKLQKLRELACGFVFDIDKNVHWIVKKTAKDIALLELMDKLAGRSVVIWADFRPLYPHIRDLLKGKCEIVDKKYGDPVKVLDDFTAGRIKTIVVNPASCGHGIDGWQNVASEAIYYTDNWSWELRRQSSDRLNRIGQTNKVTNYHIVSEGTIDRVLLQATNDKRKLSDSILRHFKEGFDK